MEVFDKLLESIDWAYAGSVILMTYILLSRVIINPRRWMKIVTSVMCGVVLGIVFYMYNQTSIPILVYSFLFQVVIYSWVVKGFMNKFNLKYNNGKGVI